MRPSKVTIERMSFQSLLERSSHGLEPYSLVLIFGTTYHLILTVFLAYIWLQSNKYGVSHDHTMFYTYNAILCNEQSGLLQDNKAQEMSAQTSCIVLNTLQDM